MIYLFKSYLNCILTYPTFIEIIDIILTSTFIIALIITLFLTIKINKK